MCSIPRCGSNVSWAYRASPGCSLRRILRSSASSRFCRSIQSGIFFDLWAALYGEITIRDGRVEQPTSATTACCVSTECRKSKVHLVKRLEASGGLGEPGTACVMPALTSAVYAATGNRIRKLPIADQARAVTWPRAKRNVATSESRATASNITVHGDPCHEHKTTLRRSQPRRDRPSTMSLFWETAGRSRLTWPKRM